MFGNNRLIPVVVVENEADVMAKMSGLRDGGVPIAEITFRNEYAPKGIAIAIERFPDMIIGAGTVINVEQAKLAYELGVKFIVSPGLSKEVALFCQEKGLPYIPGVATPTEIMAALDLGLTTLKFFPAGVYGGLPAIKALSGPFPQVRFVPTGGVDLNNLKEFAAFPKVAAIGGSFLLKGDIKANCETALSIINNI